MKPRLRDLPAWTPFVRATLVPITDDELERRVTEAHKTFPNLTRAEIEAQFRDIDKDVVFLNSRYQVNCRLIQTVHFPSDILHLSIKRIDKERVGRERYRDFMRIKDELTNPEFEAVEIYPARRNEIDTANQYHLWVFVTGGFELPFGWHGQRVVTGTSPLGGKQHPFD